MAHTCHGVTAYTAITPHTILAAVSLCPHCNIPLYICVSQPVQKLPGPAWEPEARREACSEGGGMTCCAAALAEPSASGSGPEAALDVLPASSPVEMKTWSQH